MGVSHTASSPRFRETNNNWKGGKSVASNGYVLVRVGTEHPLADVRGYAYEHRLVASTKLGRMLLAREQVHHIDGNKQNNDPANLEVLTFSQHRAAHRTRDIGLRGPGAPNPAVPCACGCGETFAQYDASGRPRRYVAGHNPPREGQANAAILTALADGAMDRASLAAVMGLKMGSLATFLSRLKAKGLVTNTAHGVWAIAGSRATRARGVCPDAAPQVGSLPPPPPPASNDAPACASPTPPTATP